MLGSHNLGDAPASLSGSDGTTGQVNTEKNRSPTSPAPRRGLSRAHPGRHTNNTLRSTFAFDRGELVAALDS